MCASVKSWMAPRLSHIHKENCTVFAPLVDPSLLLGLRGFDHLLHFSVVIHDETSRFPPTLSVGDNPSRNTHTRFDGNGDEDAL